MIAGLLLVAAALFLTARNLLEEKSAQQASEDVADVLHAAIPGYGESGGGAIVTDALGNAVETAVDAAGKSMKRVWTVLYVPCPYPFYERVKLEVAAFGGIIRQCDFGAEVELELLFPEQQAQPFLDRLTDMTSGTVEGMETGQEYRAFPIDSP